MKGVRAAQLALRCNWPLVPHLLLFYNVEGRKRTGKIRNGRGGLEIEAGESRGVKTNRKTGEGRMEKNKRAEVM